MPPIPHPSTIAYASMPYSFLFALSQPWSTDCDPQNSHPSTSSTVPFSLLAKIKCYFAPFSDLAVDTEGENERTLDVYAML